MPRGLLALSVVVALVQACAAAPTGDDGPAPAPKPSTDGRCDPMPHAGDSCGEGDAYCVESWGDPGGRSSALWCRDGRWEREEEANLPTDPE